MVQTVATYLRRKEIDVKDFDEARREREERDRSFTIGGEEFIRRVAVAPERILTWNKATAGDITPTEEEWLALYDETILAMIEPGQEEKWAKVRDPELPNPLTTGDLTALVRWLFESMVDRPTGQSSDSSPGRNGSETTSKEGSSSKPVAA